MSAYTLKTNPYLLAALALLAASARPAAAIEWGIAGGAAAPSISDGIAQMQMEAAIHDEEVQTRIVEREEYGTPEYDRMKLLEQNSQMIFEQILKLAQQAQ